MHHSEDTLLHLTGILVSEDGHFSEFEVDANRGSGRHVFGVGISVELTSIDHGEVWTLGKVLLQVGLGVTDQHLLYEKSVVRTRSNDSALLLVSRVPAGISINNEEALAGVEAVDSLNSVSSVSFWSNRNIYISPPYSLIES